MSGHRLATASRVSNVNASGRSMWRSVALPAEHGGWSLTAEPVALGLLVAWSWPGLALGAAAMLAFIARAPIKVVLVDRWRHRRLERTHLAARIATAEVAVLALLVGYVAAVAAPEFWVPLALAAPLVALELWYDMRSRSRRLIPELAGAVGIGSVATAIALADGTPVRTAWGLWVVLAVRSVSAIPHVRTQLLRSKSRPAPRGHSDLAQMVAVVTAAVAWAADLIPGAAAVVLGLLAAWHVVAVRTAPSRAVTIGIQESVLGVAVVAVTGVAVNLA